MSNALATANNSNSYRFIKIPYCQIRSNSIVLYDQYNTPPPKKHKNGFYQDYDAISRIENFKGAKTYTGAVTAGSKKTLSKAISLMVQSTPAQYVINPATGRFIKFKLNFITLTVSDKTKNLDASEAHKILLEPMLKHFRDKYPMKSYVWKAEIQNRGQIHYHITTDFVIDHKKLRNKWNALQDKNGLLNDYYNRFGHKNPNSTDVHKVDKIENIEGYLIKYMQKNGGIDRAAACWIKKFSKRRVIKSDEGYLNTALPATYFNHVRKCYTKGKIWDCSQNLKQAKYYTTIFDGVNRENIERLEKENECEVTLMDHCIFIRFYNLSASCVLSENDQLEYRKHLDSIRYFEPKIRRLKQDQPFKAPEIPKIKINACQSRFIFLNSCTPVAYKTG